MKDISKESEYLSG